MDDSHGKWDNQMEFFLSCLGYAVGLGNVWHFPFLCYKNGGAVFIIPYLLMLLIIGLPLCFIELALGQYTSLRPTKLYSSLAPWLSGIGWVMVALSGLASIYYNVIIAWTLYYTTSSFAPHLHWGHLDNPSNSKVCYAVKTPADCTFLGLHYYDGKCMAFTAADCTFLDLHYYEGECYATEDYCSFSEISLLNNTYCVSPTNISDIRGVKLNIPKIIASNLISEDFLNNMLDISGSTWNDIGEMRVELFGYLAFTWIIVAGLLAFKGGKSFGKATYFTVIFPYILLVILLIRGMTLEGAYSGMNYYLNKYDLSKLKDFNIWKDAAVQIFYSTGIGFGGLIRLSSYNRFNYNCMQDAILITLVNGLTSIIAGGVIFSMLGFLAYDMGTDMDKLVSSGSGLAFVVYPSAIKRMPNSLVWVRPIFLILITHGLYSQFTMVETVTTALMDQFTFLRSRNRSVVCLTCFIFFLCGLAFCIEGGLLMLELFNTWFAGFCLIAVALLEILSISYFYGFNRFMNLVSSEMGIYISVNWRGFWAMTMKIITPLAVILIFAFCISNHFSVQMEGNRFPDSIEILGSLMVLSSAIFLLEGVIYSLIYQRDRFFRQTENFCPEIKRV